MTSLVEAQGIAIPGRLDPVDLAFLSGEMIAVVGPNGGGKTSLLRALAQVEDAGGEVRIAGELLSGLAPNRRARLVGLLPASREMAWPISIRDLLKLGPGPLELNSFDEALERFELVEMAERRVDRLSTGERSRALLARMFAAGPRLMLLDEPLAHLDPYWVRELMGLLRTRADEKAAILVALHDLTQLARFDRVVAIHNGSVAFDGTARNFLKSEEFVHVFRLGAEALGLAVS